MMEQSSVERLENNYRETSKCGDTSLTSNKNAERSEAVPEYCNEQEIPLLESTDQSLTDSSSSSLRPNTNKELIDSTSSSSSFSKNQQPDQSNQVGFNSSNSLTVSTFNQAISLIQQQANTKATTINSSSSTDQANVNSSDSIKYSSIASFVKPLPSSNNVSQQHQSTKTSFASPTAFTQQQQQQQQQQQPVYSILTLPSIDSVHPQFDLSLNSRFLLLTVNDQVRELQTVIRDKATSRGDFKFFADRLIRLVVEEGLNLLPTENIDVKTPTGQVFHGIRYLKGNCGVSIVRSGESMEQGLRDCCRSIRIAKILIQRDENDQARVLYTKFPNDIAFRKILLLYPIMSTGRAVVESVKVLLNQGVKEENLILLNLFCSPKAAKLINKTFSKMFVLTSDINRVCPSHFANRYFGTD